MSAPDRAAGRSPLTICKVVLLGDSSVGKSSIAWRFVKEAFETNRESTIGFAFLTQTMKVPERGVVKFEIQDTAGQERYRSLAPIYYRDADYAIVVYDISQPDTLERAKNWINDLKNANTKKKVQVALVGNKVDLAKNDEAYNELKETAEGYAKDSGYLFFETSAKDNTNVTELFTAMAKSLPEATSSVEPSAIRLGESSKSGGACAC